MPQSIKDYVLENVDPKEYYQSRFPQWNPRVKSNVQCVFHRGDRKPSLAINLNNGGAKCFASSCDIGGRGIGNIVHFESQKEKISEPVAALQLYDEFIRPVVANETVDGFHRTLLQEERAQSAFVRATGISPATMEAFKIGYSLRANRYCIPIPDRFGNVINIRFYRLKSQRKASDIKIYSLVEGKGTDEERRYGGLELFPWPNFNTYSPAKPLFFMASEKETILAIQLGIQAISSTGGEGSWSGEWLDLLKDYTVGVVFDNDKGGRAAAEKIVATLQLAGIATAALTLPFPKSYKGDTDFDDWIIHKHGNQFALLRLLQSQLEMSNNGAEPPPSPLEDDATGELSLQAPPLHDNEIYSIADLRTNVGLLNRSVKTRGIIAAVSSKSFDIPWKFKVKNKTGHVTQVINIGRDLVSFVNAPDTVVTDTLSMRSGTVVKEWTALQYVSISEVEVVPIAEVATDTEGKYTVQRCFVIGINIDSNTPYELTVVPTTLPKSQEKILIIIKAVEVSRAIDTWRFDENETKEFDTFRPDDETVITKLYSLADEIAANHTKIYSRSDWHIVCLLSWFCPIGWYFPGETTLQRGWLNSLAVGDTQTGKSQVVATLQNLLKLGDIVNAENCTFVGLVGGAIKTGSGQMMLRWGRLPLCDRKLVIIEELSGLSVEEISNMSEVRSRGIARLDKGGLASQTPARTRLIALSNVRAMQKNLAQYLSGVKAIQELIGHPEDISRFDLIVTLIDSEVSSDIINSTKDETTEATFTWTELQRLCQFAWALKPDQIRFSDDAYIACLEWTKKMQEVYHPSVPIFKAASGRLLLARIGASIATLQFNWDGKVINVEDRHIEAAVTFLRALYDKASFGYLEYSRQMQDRERVKVEAELTKAVKDNIRKEILMNVFESLIHSAKFTRDEVQAIGSMQPFQADDLIGAFLRARVIRKGEANTWEITPAGKRWMEKVIHERKS